MTYRLPLLLFVVTALLRTAGLTQTTSIELHWRGSTVPLDAATQQQVREQALKILQSSNFHSGPDDTRKFFAFSEVQRSYREAVASSFLVVSFSPPQRIQTVGGEVIAAELVLGLNRSDYAHGVFTIDPSAAIVSHAKYAGVLCIEILQTIKRLVE